MERSNKIMILGVVTMLIVGFAWVKFTDPDNESNNRDVSVYNSDHVSPGFKDVNEVISLLNEADIDVSLLNSRETIPLIAESWHVRLSIGDEQIEGGINLFTTLEDKDAWLSMSVSMDGVAVSQNDELWAISLDSDRTDALEIAADMSEDLQRVIDS